MLKLKSVLSLGFLILSFGFVLNACTKAFGDETVSTSKAQPAERLGNLALLKRTTTFEFSDLNCTKETEVFSCKGAVEPVSNVFMEKDNLPPSTGLSFPQVDGVLFDAKRDSYSITLNLYYKSRPDLTEESLHALAKETFEKSTALLKTRTFMLMVYE
jgi:hypothetical protein